MPSWETYFFLGAAILAVAIFYGWMRSRGASKSQKEASERGAKRQYDDPKPISEKERNEQKAPPALDRDE